MDYNHQMMIDELFIIASATGNISYICNNVLLVLG